MQTSEPTSKPSAVTQLVEPVFLRGMREDENQDPEALWPASSACTVANNKEVEGKD